NLIEEQIKERVNQNQNSGINDLIMQLQTKTRKVFLNEIQNRKNYIENLKLKESNLSDQLQKKRIDLDSQSAQIKNTTKEKLQNNLKEQLQNNLQEIFKQSETIKSLEQGIFKKSGESIVFSSTSKKDEVLEQLKNIKDFYDEYHDNINIRKANGYSQKLGCYFEIKDFYIKIANYSNLCFLDSTIADFKLICDGKEKFDFELKKLESELKNLKETLKNDNTFFGNFLMVSEDQKIRRLEIISAFNFKKENEIELSNNKK
ncbi:MAG: hypothetical protein LBJ32_01605, partial [Oscillospiraceae bacterium]|nr:hypothetical protein [Oscillospiraceae bacterium]